MSPKNSRSSSPRRFASYSGNLGEGGSDPRIESPHGPNSETSAAIDGDLRMCSNCQRYSGRVLPVSRPRPSSAPHRISDRAASMPIFALRSRSGSDRYGPSGPVLHDRIDGAFGQALDLHEPHAHGF